MDPTYSVFLVTDNTSRGKEIASIFNHSVTKLKEMDLKSDKDKALVRSVSFTSADWSSDKDFISEFFEPIE
jgi:hypothetical protein